MMSRIMKTADTWIWKIFNDRKWSWLWWNIGQRKRPEIFFEVSKQSFSDAFPQQNPT
jgi:hypothetical protein